MNLNRLTPAQHGAMRPPSGSGLARYGSAPGSLLAAIAESVTRGDPAPPPVSRFYSAESSGLTSCESSCRTDGGGPPPPLERAYGGSGEIRLPPPPQQQQHQKHPLAAASPLFRHSSSPAGLLSRLMADPHDHTVEMLICTKDWELGEESGQHTVVDKELEDYFKNQFLDEDSGASTTTAA